MNILHAWTVNSINRLVKNTFQQSPFHPCPAFPHPHHITSSLGFVCTKKFKHCWWIQRGLVPWISWNPSFEGLPWKYYAQMYYVHYAHTGAMQKPHLFPATYADNHLVCSLCISKQNHTFNSAGFKHNNLDVKVIAVMCFAWIRNQSVHRNNCPCI